MGSDYVRENWRWRGEPRTGGPAVIFDIDGVVADAAGRQHYLDWGTGRGSSTPAATIPIIEEIERLLELLDQSLTDRAPDRSTAQGTAAHGWLARALRTALDLLIMREYGDYSGSTS